MRVLTLHLDTNNCNNVSLSVKDTLTYTVDYKYSVTNIEYFYKDDFYIISELSSYLIYDDDSISYLLDSFLNRTIDYLNEHPDCFLDNESGPYIEKCFKMIDELKCCNNDIIKEVALIFEKRILKYISHNNFC